MPMSIIQTATELYGLEGYEYRAVSGHEGGRNEIRICSRDGKNRYVFRVSALEDRTEEEYLAESQAGEFAFKRSVAEFRRFAEKLSALRSGMTPEEIHAVTRIDLWFLHKLQKLADFEARLASEPLTDDLYKEAKRLG